MPAKRLSMRKLTAVLRLHFEHGFSNRAISRTCSISPTTVGEYIQRFLASGLSWPLPEDLDETRLHRKLLPDSTADPSPAPLQMPDMKYLHRELRRPGVTLMLLWEEYRARDPGGYSRTQFYHHYRSWAGRLNPTMRQDHKAGEKVFVDYAGKRPEIVDPRTGEIRKVELFIGCLGASGYIYAEATSTQQLPDWISSHIRMLESFGAVPALVVPDNLKSGVNRACRYEPDLNPTYQDLCDHYDLAVLPARKKKPRDKAKAESAVQIVERKILGGLRDRSFFSLAELNEAIREVLSKVNNRNFQKLDVSRRELFEQLDKPAMRPLPARRYEYGAWKKAKVSIDYHVEVAWNYYSVHYSLIQKPVDVRLTQSTVEIWFKGRRVASHLRLYGKGRHQTLEAHRPPSHKEYLAWTPERIQAWGRKSGPCTEALMGKVMESRRHPEQGYRSCLGILRLGKEYTPERLENACRRALKIQGYSYKSIKSILERSLDMQPIPDPAPSPRPPASEHENIRGPEYYPSE